MKKRWLLLSMIMCLCLSSCVPQTDDGETVNIEQLSDTISFYPQETGARWAYLPDGALLDEAPINHVIEGPTVVEGELWTAWRIVGRGIDERYFRQYRDDGVYLLRRDSPGAITTYDPPRQELPAESLMRVGSTWGGQTTATIIFEAADPGNQPPPIQSDYTYTVVDKRTVMVPSGEFEIFSIVLESTQNSCTRWRDQK